MFVTSNSNRLVYSILSRVQALGYKQDICCLGLRYEAIKGPILVIFDKIDALTDDGKPVCHLFNAALV